MPTPQRVGGKLCLLIGTRTCPLLRSKHKLLKLLIFTNVKIIDHGIFNDS